MNLLSDLFFLIRILIFCYDITINSIDMMDRIHVLYNLKTKKN